MSRFHPEVLGVDGESKIFKLQVVDYDFPATATGQQSTARFTLDGVHQLLLTVLSSQD